jgi:hypothetical protein
MSTQHSKDLAAKKADGASRTQRRRGTKVRQQKETRGNK